MMWPAGMAIIRRLNLTTFGRPLTFTPNGGVAVSTTPAGEQLVGVFRTPTDSVALDVGPPVLSIHPTVFCDLTDFAVAPVEGDRFDIQSRAYTVKEVVEDGEGGVLIELGVLAI